MKLTFVLLCVAGALLCSGCATIVTKANFDLSVNSNPTGATVTVKDNDGKVVYTGITPCSIPLKSGAGYFKSASYFFDFEKEGYKPANQTISADIEPWYFGNLIGLVTPITTLVFVIGGMLVVDPLTGAMWKLEDDVFATLSEVPSASISLEKTDIVPEKVSSDSGSRIENILKEIKKLEQQRDAETLSEKEFEKRRKKLVEELEHINVKE